MGFRRREKGLSFIPILVGHIIALFSCFPFIKRNIYERSTHPDEERAQYESRLWWSLFTAPCLPLGLIGFAWTTQGPPLPWVVSMIFLVFVGIADYGFYMATVDYLICAYGPYCPSATAGYVSFRALLCGILAIPTTSFFTNIGGRYHIQYALTILCKFYIVIFVTENHCLHIS